MAVSTLPPVPAPLAPQRGLCLDVGPWMRGEPYRLTAVTGKSFTASHHGKRERHQLADWHAWLQRLSALGPIHLNGHPMLPPGPAPLVQGTVHVRVQAATSTAWTPEQRRKRLLRATNEVIKRYRMVAEAGPENRLVFALHGGSEVWRVDTDPTGARSPTCTCPDFVYRFKPQVACKHVLAVLLSHPNLRFLALDCFL